MLDLYETLVHDMRGCDEGTIKMDTEFRKVWELLASDKSKLSQRAGDGGSIISNMIEFESNTKIEFEHVYVKIKNDNEDKIINRGLSMELECDNTAKEERTKCMRENKCDNGFFVGNTSLKCGK